MVRHMDTNQYSNILKAIGNNGNTLSTQQQAQITIYSGDSYIVIWLR